MAQPIGSRRVALDQSCDADFTVPIQPNKPKPLAAKHLSENMRGAERIAFDGGSRPRQCHHIRPQTVGAPLQWQAEDYCHFGRLILNELHNGADDFALGRPIWIAQLRLDVIWEFACGSGKPRRRWLAGRSCSMPPIGVTQTASFGDHPNRCRCPRQF